MFQFLKRVCTPPSRGDIRHGLAFMMVQHSTAVEAESICGQLFGILMWFTFDQQQIPGYMKFNDLWTFNGTSWSKILSDAPWEVRSGLCAVILPKKVLGIFGGNGRYVQEPWPPIGIHVPSYPSRSFNIMRYI